MAKSSESPEVEEASDAAKKFIAVFKQSYSKLNSSYRDRVLSSLKYLSKRKTLGSHPLSYIHQINQQLPTCPLPTGTETEKLVAAFRELREKVAALFTTRKGKETAIATALIRIQAQTIQAIEEIENSTTSTSQSQSK